MWNPKLLKAMRTPIQHFDVWRVMTGLRGPDTQVKGLDALAFGAAEDFKRNFIEPLRAWALVNPAYWRSHFNVGDPIGLEGLRTLCEKLINSNDELKKAVGWHAYDHVLGALRGALNIEEDAR